MEIEWREELMRQAQEVMIKGGELIFKVEKRGNERIPEIFIYSGNKTKCKTEILAE